MFVCMYNFYIQISRVMLKAYLFRIKKGGGGNIQQKKGKKPITN